MEETKKIKEDQLKKIQDQQKRLNDILYKVGTIEAEKHAWLHEFAKVNKDVEDFRVDLEAEYGPVNINVETGEYTPIEDKK